MQKAFKLPKYTHVMCDCMYDIRAPSYIASFGLICLTGIRFSLITLREVRGCASRCPHESAGNWTFVCLLKARCADSIGEFSMFLQDTEPVNSRMPLNYYIVTRLSAKLRVFELYSQMVTCIYRLRFSSTPLQPK